jgi:hypothetical protein
MVHHVGLAVHTDLTHSVLLLITAGAARYYRTFTYDLSGVGKTALRVQVKIQGRTGNRPTDTPTCGSRLFQDGRFLSLRLLSLRLLSLRLLSLRLLSLRLLSLRLLSLRLLSLHLLSLHLALQMKDHSETGAAAFRDHPGNKPHGHGKHFLPGIGHPR